MRYFVILGVLALCTGCATITRGSNDVLVVETTPSGAECTFSNGYSCASTPCSIKMPRRSQGVVTCNKAGYEEASGSFTHKTAGSGAAGMAGNVVFGGIIGAGVDAGTGATQDITPNPIVLTLYKKGASAPVPEVQSTAQEVGE